MLYTDAFVGRRTEFARLAALLDATGDGSSRAAQIIGDPGIGKTRLLGEFADHARRSGWLAYGGRAAEFEQLIPFGVFADALQDHLGAADPTVLTRIDGADLAQLRAIFPALPAADPAQGERHRLYHAVRALLEALSRPDGAAGRPGGLVLILDDLHWADEGSTELVEFLLRHPPRGRLVLAVAHRPRQVQGRLRHALAQAAVETVRLGPLAEADIGELLPYGTEAAARQRLYAASAGNPFYLQALAGRPDTDGIGPVDEGRTGGGASIPEPVRAALAAEFAALTPRQLLVAQACAVAGDAVGAGLIARTAELDTDDVLAELDELARRDLVRTAGSGGRFGFRHPLVRRVSYDTAGAGWRVAAHARAAAALRAGGASATELAHHVERSAEPGDPDAVEVLREAAVATLPHSPAAAAHWLSAALGLLPATPEAIGVRLDLMVMQVRAFGLSGRLHDSRAVLHEIHRLLPAELAEQRAQAVAFGAYIERLLGRYAEARAQLLAELAAQPDQHGQVALELKLGLATGIIMRTDEDAERDWPEEALATARRHSDRAALAGALATCVLADHMAGRVDQRTVARLDEAAALIDAMSDGELAARLESMIGLGAAESCHDRLNDATRHLLRAEATARATGQGHAVSFIHLMLGTTCLIRGELERAAEHIDDELEAAYLTGSLSLRGLAMRNHCLVELFRGNTDEALRLGKEALAFEENNPSIAGLAAGALGMAHYFAGDPATCVDLMVTGGGGPNLWRADPVERSYWFEILAAAEAALGRTDESERWADRAFANAAGLPRRIGLAHLARAHSRLAGDPDGAAADAVRAAELLRQAGDRVVAGRAHVLAGRALAALAPATPDQARPDQARPDQARLDQARPDQARLDQAREQFAEACELFESCGAAGHAAHAQRERRRMEARRHRRSPGASPATELTPRERQVAELAARGLTNREIGEALFLSPRTVNVHLGRVFAKLGVSRRAAIAARLD